MSLASDDEITGAGLIPGYASPIGVKNIKIVADNSICSGANFVVGANVPDKHFRNANFPRDFEADYMSDIALAAYTFCFINNPTIKLRKLSFFWSWTLGYKLIGE